MRAFRTVTLAVTLGLAAAIAASPASAKKREPAGYAARAEAIGADTGGLTTNNNRASALRDCNEKAAPLRDYTWGDQQSDVYRACMAQRGQAE
jgi:hypothetical protein